MVGLNPAKNGHGFIPNVLVADNIDFIPIAEEIVFDMDTINGTECFSLSIADDEVFEDHETFRVILQNASNKTIEFINSILLVTIVDEDGELVSKYWEF